MFNLKTKLLQLFLKDREKTARLIDTVTDILQKGGVVVIPTETCYSLAVDATNHQAVQKLFDLGVIRGPGTNVIVADLRMAKEYGDVKAHAEHLANSFMPGPLTLVVERREDSLLSPIISDDRSFSFRVSSNLFTRALSSELGKPITVFIVNNEALYSIREVTAKFDGKVDAIVNAGELPQILPSTIIDTRNDSIALIRAGPLSLEEIKAELASNPVPG